MVNEEYEPEGPVVKIGVEDPAVSMPLLPTAIPPKLAMGLVKAQAVATTVDNDGHNTQHHYKYPTQAAIASKARTACEVGGLAILMLGWETFMDTIQVHDGQQLIEVPRLHVRVPVSIIHESGESLPVFHATMPVVQHKGKGPDKAIAGALSLLRKYVIGQLLNMGWSDHTDDVDQRDDSKLSDQRIRPPAAKKLQRVAAKPAVASPKPATGPVSVSAPKMASGGVPSAITDNARQATRILKDQFEFPDMDAIYRVATGRDTPWPGDPDVLDFLAIGQLAAACELANQEERNVPGSHAEFKEVCALEDSPMYDPFYADGEKTHSGLAAMLRVKRDMGGEGGSNG